MLDGVFRLFFFRQALQLNSLERRAFSGTTAIPFPFRGEFGCLALARSGCVLCVRAD